MNVMVSSGHRRKGLAKALMAHAEDQCRCHWKTKIVAPAQADSLGCHLFNSLKYPGHAYFAKELP